MKKITYDEYLNIKDELLDIYDFDNKILSQFNLKLIKLKELKPNHFYLGECRNSDISLWDGKKFNYIRSGWDIDDVYISSINCVEKETYKGHDVFIPFGLLTSMTEDIKEFFLKEKFIIDSSYN